MPGKQRQGKSVPRTLRKTRVTRSRLHCLKSNPDRNIGCPAAILTQNGVVVCSTPGQRDG